MTKVLISLFTAYSISYFLQNYLSMESIVYLFIGMLAFTGFVHFLKENSILAKALINFSIATHTSYLVVAIFFETLQIQTPQWLLYKDELITAAVFVLLTVVTSLIVSKDASNIFVNALTASAMGLALTLLIFEIFDAYGVILLYPIFAITSYIIISGTSRALILYFVGLSLSYGLPFFLVMTEVVSLTSLAILLFTPWLVTMFVALAFKDKPKVFKRTYGSADLPHIPRWYEHNSNESYHTDEDRGFRSHSVRGDYTQDSFTSNDYEESKPVESFFKDDPKPDTSMDYLDIHRDDERGKAINDEYRNKPSWQRDIEVERRERNVPSWQQTDIDSLDDHYN